MSASLTASSMEREGRREEDMGTSSCAGQPPTWRGLVTVIGLRPSGRLDEVAGGVRTSG